MWRQGYKIVAGLDEVGRGCFAGPVVCGLVVFDEGTDFSEVIINDSKKLRPKVRETSDRWIRKNAKAWGIGEASVSEINKYHLARATNMAFRRAIISCGIRVDYLLIDAFFIPHVRGLRRKNQKAIVKGDQKSLSIAAASIIAKVYRDRKMLQFSRDPKHTMYGWGRNKGYGTREHQEAIRTYGITKLHRIVFVNTFLSRTP